MKKEILSHTLHKALRDGYVKGLRARRGFEVHMEWKDGRLILASILSHLGNTCRIKITEKISFHQGIEILIYYSINQIQ